MPPDPRAVRSEQTVPWKHRNHDRKRYAFGNPSICPRQDRGQFPFAERVSSEDFMSHQKEKQRTAAVQRLRQLGYENPDEKMVKQAMKGILPEAVNKRIAVGATS